MNGITRYPLTWPAGWRRTIPAQRRRAQFKDAREKVSIAVAVGRINRELDLLAGYRLKGVLISTNVRTRMDGLPRSDQAEPLDPGVALYWTVHGNTADHQVNKCMAIDIYNRVADSLAAIAATVEAMRAIERHGGAVILDRAFAGFTALPAPEQWFQVLGVPADATRAQIEMAHARLAMKHHPDRGGDTATMARINLARDEGLRA